MLKKYPNLPVLFVSFENIVSSPVTEAKKIAPFLELDLTDEMKDEIKHFVGFGKVDKIVRQGKRIEKLLRRASPRSFKHAIKKMVKK